MALYREEASVQGGRIGELEKKVENISGGGYPVAADVTNITDPSTATAEDVANKLNALLTSLRTAGLLA